MVVMVVEIFRPNAGLVSRETAGVRAVVSKCRPVPACTLSAVCNKVRTRETNLVDIAIKFFV